MVKDPWVDYTKSKKLNGFKESLPISIQRIIEFAHFLYQNRENYKLDMNEIDNDLKYQYRKYRHNEKELKKLYHNYNPSEKNDWGYSDRYQKSKDYDKRYCMLFGNNNIFTVTQYVFYQIRCRSNKNSGETVKQLLMKHWHY